MEFFRPAFLDGGRGKLKESYWPNREVVGRGPEGGGKKKRKNRTFSSGKVTKRGWGAGEGSVVLRGKDCGNTIPEKIEKKGGGK